VSPIGKALFALALVAGALLIWAAQADAVSGQTMGQTVVVAQRLFANSPCGPDPVTGNLRAHIVVVSQEEIDRLTGLDKIYDPSSEDGHKHAGGAALQNNSDGSCTIWMTSAMINGGDQNFCVAYVHEYGHLAGGQHGDPRMDDYHDCEVVLPSLSLSDARATLRAFKPEWRVRCQERDTRAVVGCVARRRGHLTHRYQVWREYVGGPIKITGLTVL
jgi:hypothetical protein